MEKLETSTLDSIQRKPWVRVNTSHFTIHNTFKRTSHWKNLLFKQTKLLYKKFVRKIQVKNKAPKNKNKKIVVKTCYFGEKCLT